MSNFIDAEVAFTGDLFNAPKATGEVRQSVKQTLVAVSKLLAGELERASPVGETNNLAKSWTYAYEDSSMTAKVSSGVEYAAPTELGRKAAPVPRKALEGWVRRVINPGKESRVRSIAFLIARKKAEKPTPGQFFARRTFEATIPALSKAFLGPCGALIVRRLES